MMKWILYALVFGAAAYAVLLLLSVVLGEGGMLFAGLLALGGVLAGLMQFSRQLRRIERKLDQVLSGKDGQDAGETPSEEA